MRLTQLHKHGKRKLKVMNVYLFEDKTLLNFVLRKKKNGRKKIVMRKVILL